MNKRFLPDTIDGDRLILRRHAPAFAEAMFAAIDRDRDRLARFLPWARLTTAVENSRAFIADSRAKWDDAVQFDYAIFARDGDAYAGNINIFSIKWEHDVGEIGYWLDSRFEGQGLMSGAVRALEATCFAHDFHRLEIRCDTDNERSAAIPKRLGYTLDGTLREDRIRNGAYCDTHVFSKLRGDR